jgi:hypothetical protein
MTTAQRPTKRSKHLHTYGAGTRLSSLYTAGRNGLPRPRYAGDTTSAGSKAWREGHREWLCEQEAARG